MSVSLGSLDVQAALVNAFGHLNHADNSREFYAHFPDADTPKYQVHIFAVVGLKVSDVPAGSHQEAIDAALSRTDLYQRFAGPDTEYAEGLSHFLVDMAGDEDFRKSQWFDARDGPFRPFLERLVACGQDDGRINGHSLSSLLAEAKNMLERAV